MRKALARCVLLIILITVCFQAAVFAEVITTKRTEGFKDYIYVAGSPDRYPIEYYDSDLQSYCGVIPDLLKEISSYSGINFVYINGDKKDKNMLGKNLQADIISCAQSDENLSYAKDYIELISYEDNGEIIKCGLIFTTLAKDDKIDIIKSAAKEISSDKRNGIYLSYTSQNAKTEYKWLIAAIIAAVLLLVVVVALFVSIRQIQKDNAAYKVTDIETGMGNLQFFKYHFKYTISDVSRNLYYIAYIVIDSGYLRSYHGDSSFEDVLKYTSSVLSEHTGEKEISARITENGFAFAFQSTNDKDAQKRLREVMDKLNHFENMKEKDNKLVFHSAVYHLSPSDRNCELLIFNLRKNCNKIFGTETEIIYCDTHSMNKTQEEKEITESVLNGFENNEFKMYLQFVVDNKTKEITSAEVLSRWDNREKGLIGPGKYIRNMESAGLISRHDFYMFDLACRQLEKWNNTRYSNITISCNFTRITLSEENFIDKLKMISQGYNFDKSKLAI